MRSFRIAVSFLVISGAVAGCSQKDDTQVATGSTSQAITSVNVYHSQQSGGGANGFVFQQDSQSSFSGGFDAWENKTSKSRTAGLSFWASGSTFQQVCSDEQICKWWDYSNWPQPPQCTDWETVHWCYEDVTKSYWMNGYGDIPSGDFRVGAHTAHLTTDLSQDSSFYAYQCTWDGWFNYSCGPVTGTIDLTWRDNGMFTTDSNGVTNTSSTFPYSQYSTHSTGHQSMASANVTGTFLGYNVTTQGNITLSKETIVSKDVFKAPPPPPPGDGGAPPPPPPPADGGTD